MVWVIFDQCECQLQENNSNGKIVFHNNTENDVADIPSMKYLYMLVVKYVTIF